jgi:predicted aspartyl protease
MKIKEHVSFRGNTALVTPRVRGSDGTKYPFEGCVLDSGCPYHLVVSPEVAKDIQPMSNLYGQGIHLADGKFKSTKVFLGEICWLTTQPKLIPITIMDPCPDQLIGFPLLKRTKIVFGRKSGYVKSLSWIDWPSPK